MLASTVAAAATRRALARPLPAGGIAAIADDVDDTDDVVADLAGAPDDDVAAVPVQPVAHANIGEETAVNANNNADMAVEATV